MCYCTFVFFVFLLFSFPCNFFPYVSRLFASFSYIFVCVCSTIVCKCISNDFNYTFSFFLSLLSPLLVFCVISPCRAACRSSDTEDYMPLNATITVQSGPEPPKPPPPPPAPPMLNLFATAATGTIGSSKNSSASSAAAAGSQTGTAKSNIPPPPPPQDSTIRKQQQPLSAISIQDLNSVQVRKEGKPYLTHLAMMWFGF